MILMPNIRFLGVFWASNWESRYKLRLNHLTIYFSHKFLVNAIFCDGSKCGKLVQMSGGNMNKFSQAHFSVVFEYSGHHYRISMYRIEHEESGDYAQFIWKDDSAKKKMNMKYHLSWVIRFGTYLSITYFLHIGKSRNQAFWRAD